MAELNLEEQLNARLLNAVNQAVNQGFNHPHNFTQMLANFGAIETVNRLLQGNNIAQGLTRLWELQLLHLSMEAIILQEPYCQLFTPEQLQIARTRLTDFKYQIPAN